jgi:uncharacterized membrane protein SirB2
MDYANVRALHITCAIVSISLFVARGGLQLAGMNWRRWRWLRIVPHVNDTVLLGAATALAVMSAQYPLMQGWLTAKVVALLLYIAVGRVALQPHRTKGVQVLAFGAALLCVGWIVGAAITRSPWLGLV